MPERAPTPAPLLQALARLLRPLCRLMLRHGLPFGAFEALAKRAYLDVAMAEFSLPGRKPSVSRAAILSGLTRKEVQRLLGEPAPMDGDAGARYNRSARVLTAWLRHAASPAGEPLALAPEGDDGFAGLVRRHGGDVPARAMLDELLRVGAVRQRDDGRVELVARGHVPRHDAADKLHILGTDVADLVTTIDHNLQHADTAPRFQRKVLYHGIPAAVAPAFHALAAAESQALLERLDAWLAAHDTAGPDEPRVRLGLGIHAIQTQAAPRPSPESPTP